MPYVDGFVIPLPKRNVKAYRRMAALAGRIWREHGALEYRECVADQLTLDDGTGHKISPFPKMTRLRPGETVVFAWIVYRSRAHRDRVNAAVMKDPRLKPPKNMPFDPRRMAYGGFKTLVAR